MLRRDPLPLLLATGDPALTWAVRHDLLEEERDPRELWNLPAVRRACSRQRPDGGWDYPGRNARIRTNEDYSQLATYLQLRILIAIYRLDRRHSSIGPAAEFLLGRQTSAGDIRGMYGHQYSPNYTADILNLLTLAGLGADPRVTRGLDWLLAMTQDDGGWALPLRTAGAIKGGFAAVMKQDRPIEPDRTRPSSHLITGVVLRALALHPQYRRRAATVRAATLLAGRFLAPDRYADRRAASYWTKLTFPFRWTDVVSALDAIAMAGLPAAQPDVMRGLVWLESHQGRNGLWRTGYPKTRDPLVDHWVTFAATRVCKRLGVWRVEPKIRVLAAG
jgi:hypothetical protein